MPPIERLQAEFYTETQELDFGQVAVNASRDLPLKIENPGYHDLIVCVRAPDVGDAHASCATQMNRFEPDEGHFSAAFEGVTEQGTWILEAGAAREIAMTFSPRREGEILGIAIFVHNGKGEPEARITLRGVGVRPDVNVSPTALDFGDVTVGERLPLDVTLENRGPFRQTVFVGPIDQTSIVFGTTNALQTDTPHGEAMKVEIPGHQSATFQAWFAPLEEGQAQATLRVSYCADCNVDIILLGQGRKPVVEIEPPELDFGVTDEAATVHRQFRIKNVGASPVTVASVELESGTSTEFVIDPAFIASLPLKIAPDRQTSVDVAYTGAAPGADSGSVVITTNAWNNTATAENEAIRAVNLVAATRGPDINALPTTVNFGTVAILGTPARKNLLLENTGTSVLRVSRLELNTPTTELSMPSSPAVPLSIEPGASVTVTLGYAPVDAGKDEGEFVVTSDDRDENPLIIPVVGIGGVPSACAVSVSPPEVNFGLVERGRRATLPVEVRNTGAQPCAISQIAVTGDAAFRTPNAGGSFAIASGSSQPIEVMFEPTANGDRRAELSFASDDPGQATIVVPLSGSSAPSDIRVIPSEIDFAVVPVTCGSPIRTVTVYNTGSTNVTLTRVALDSSASPEFEVCIAGAPTAGRCTSTLALPTTIRAGQDVSFRVRYRPADIGGDTAVLFLTHSASQIPVAVPLHGSGEVSPTVTDRFTQAASSEVDVLFVIDNSGSMEDEQRNLGGNLSAFLSAARSQGVDYQIGVVSTDVFDSRQSGRLLGNPKVITRNTPNDANVFRTTVNLGTNGSGNEQGLEAAYRALSSPLITDPGANLGFLRVDAALAIIVVSDEQDSSPRPQSFYENFFRNIKGFQGGPQFSFNAVVVPTNPPCSGQGSMGSRYIQTAQATGGMVESICTTNWGNTLSNIGLNTFGLKSRFNLSSSPVPSTFSVVVNGQAVPSVSPGGQTRWRFDQANNVLAFDASAIPSANAQIEITYTVACLP